MFISHHLFLLPSGRDALSHHLQRARTAQALHDFLALEVSTQPVQARLPAILVAAIEFLCRNRLRLGSKARLNPCQEGPFGAFFQRNFHQRTGCSGKRDLGVTHRIGRPAKGKTVLWLDDFDHARIGAPFICPGKLDGTAYAKIHVTHYPKPTGKLFWFRDGIPDTPTRDRQTHGSFDTIRYSHWISSQWRKMRMRFSQ